jgi:hypothetical protein
LPHTTISLGVWRRSGPLKQRSRITDEELRRTEAAYNNEGLIKTITSYDAASSGSVVTHRFAAMVMASDPQPPGVAGTLSNGRTSRYMLELESSAGFVAWKTIDGPTCAARHRLANGTLTIPSFAFALTGYAGPSSRGED